MPRAVRGACTCRHGTYCANRPVLRTGPARLSRHRRMFERAKMKLAITMTEHEPNGGVTQQIEPGKPCVEPQ